MASGCTERYRLSLAQRFSTGVVVRTNHDDGVLCRQVKGVATVEIEVHIIADGDPPRCHALMGVSCVDFHGIFGGAELGTRETRQAGGETLRGPAQFRNFTMPVEDGLNVMFRKEFWQLYEGLTMR